MMSKPAAACVLLLCTAHALILSVSAVPEHWTSFYYDQRALAGRQQQQQAAVCDASAISPASLVCKSARLTTPGGNNTHIHVCPVDGKLVAYIATLVVRTHFIYLIHARNSLQLQSVWTVARGYE